MESKQIEDILERYFEAETSVKEEERLRTYFNSGAIPEHLLQYKELFSYLRENQKEEYATQIDLPVEKPGKKKVYSWVAVAASVVLLLGIAMQQGNPVNEFGTYEDPELAMQETKRALEMLSHYMNTGTEDLGYLQEFNNTKNKIIKNN